ncbi:MAG TPA: hypothetical protein DIS80_09035 [Verrucomicrobiales bacterium]|nr:hypothetical protein [Verrucomicrobiales bacterium]
MLTLAKVTVSEGFDSEFHPQDIKASRKQHGTKKEFTAAPSLNVKFFARSKMREPLKPAIDSHASCDLLTTQ